MTDFFFGGTGCNPFIFTMHPVSCNLRFPSELSTTAISGKLKLLSVAYTTLDGQPVRGAYLDIYPKNAAD